MSTNPLVELEEFLRANGLIGDIHVDPLTGDLHALVLVGLDELPARRGAKRRRSGGRRRRR